MKIKTEKSVKFFSPEFYEIIENTTDKFIKSLGNFLPEKPKDVEENLLLKCENFNVQYNGVAYYCYGEMFAKNDKPFVFTINPMNNFLFEEPKSKFIQKSKRNYKKP